MDQVTAAPPRPVSRRGPAAALLDLFSNVWLGIFLAALLFIYCTIGSAIPAVRQHPAIEMTEFEWFHWWPFNLLVVLFTLNLATVTIRRIPLRPVNAGVWMIHTGIIVMVLGSYWYFTTKLEGDTPVFRRRVEITVPGTNEPATLVALPGNQTSVNVGGQQWQFQIQSTNSDWPILSEEHKGERAYACNLMVRTPDGESFIRQLLAGYPQYTEDIIPGQGRAVKATGNKLVRDDVNIRLAYEPQEYFHLMDTWALFVRRVGEAQWKQRPIEDLPRYHDRIASREQVFFDPHHPVPIRPIDLTVPPPPGGDPLASASVHVTGYLRYAHLKQRWRDGGDRLNPVLEVTVLPDHASPDTHELVAFDRTRNHSEGGMIQFLWLSDFSDVNDLPTDSAAELRVEVPSAGIAFDLPLTDDTVVGSEGDFTPIEGTDFAYRVINVSDGLVLPEGRGSVSVAMVDIKTPEETFTRMVADRAEMTRDMRGDMPDPHAAHARTPQAADERIRMRYTPQTAPIIFAAYPRGLFLAVNGPEGRVLGRDVRVGEAVEVVPGLRIRPDRLLTHAVSEVKPFIVPPPQRQRDVGESFAMIRLEINDGRRHHTRWLRFNQYALPDEQYAYSGRFAYQPERFRLSDGTMVEVLFSRQRRPLPTKIALDHFELDEHLGGYTGQVSTIRNYISELRFWDGNGWTDGSMIKVNAPTEYGGFWYFQSMWDKPPSNNPTAGMNYTGLGVGNRNGVYVQLAGCVISVVGMVFAFYVKPVMKRRRAAHSRAKVEQFTETVAEERPPAPQPVRA